MFTYRLRFRYLVAAITVLLTVGGLPTIRVTVLGAPPPPRRPAVAPKVTCMGTLGFQAAVNSPFAVGLQPDFVVAGDFNSDGRPDLATASYDSSTVTVLLGDGNGGFSTASGAPVAVGSRPISVAVADFNGDGQLDLATANYGDNSVTVLLGDGNGGFSPAPGAPFPVGTHPESVVAADFNGDGHADLATANTISNTVTVLLGDGSGGFSPAPGSSVAVGSFPISVAAADFNGDSRIDLTTANLDGNNVTVLLGNGSGSFSPASGSPVAVGNHPIAVAAADFNGDRRIDLATANIYSNNVTVLLGNGSGGFSPAAGSPVAVGNGPESVAVADFDGDGRPDLAIANAGSGNVTVLLGDGSGGFSPAGPPVAVGSVPESVAVADFNGDGRPDLATANYRDNNVTVLLNTCTPFTATATTTATATATTTATTATTATITTSATIPPPSATATPTACVLAFSDVQPTDYFAIPVHYLACHSVISGYSDGTFRPYNNTTRGQLAKIVTLASGFSLTTPATPTFADVPTDNVFYAYIETLVARHVISGYSDGLYRPSNPVTRGQLAKIVVGAAGGGLVSPPTPSFRDLPAGNVFYSFVETAVCRGLLAGYSDGTVRPAAVAFRGQIAKIVYRAVTAPQSCTQPTVTVTPAVPPGYE